MFKLLVILTYAALYPFIALLMTWPDRPGVRQVSEGSGEWRKMEETGCEVICAAPTTPAIKGKVVVVDIAGGPTFMHFSQESQNSMAVVTRTCKKQQQQQKQHCYLSRL